VYSNNIEITLFSVLFCILTIVTITTIINYYNHSNNQFSTFSILAQSDNKEDNKEGNEIDKEDKKKKIAEINKQEKEDDDADSWITTDQDLITKYNYRNLVIPKVYQNTPGGSIYKFKHDNPNGLIQIDETKNENVFTKQNRDGSWRIEYGKPRIDIHTKDAGILPDKVDQLNNLSEGKIQSWNFSELQDIGYWYKPSDWKNVEVTLIFKLIDSSHSKGEDHAISIVTRSISHSQLENEYKKSDDEPNISVEDQVTITIYQMMEK
jgi:hypothetical protein